MASVHVNFGKAARLKDHHRFRALPLLLVVFADAGLDLAGPSTVSPVADTMRFCSECNNIMHPKENKADRKLVYACNRCSYKEDAQSGSCVYRNNLITTAGNKLDIVQTDVVDDPTLQRSKNAICEKCNYNEAVFFQADEGAKSQSLSLIFVCTNRACGHKWVS